MDKTYQAEICLGRTSATYDAEGVDDSIPAREIPQSSNDDLAALVELTVWRNNTQKNTISNIANSCPNGIYMENLLAIKGTFKL